MKHLFSVKQYPHYLLLYFALFVFLIAFVHPQNNKLFDFSFQNASYSFSYFMVFFIIAFVHVLIWAMLFLTQKIHYNYALLWCSVIMTIVAACWGLWAIHEHISGANNLEYDYMVNGYRYYHAYTFSDISIVLSSFMWYFAQFLWILNCLLGFIKKL